MPNWTTNLTDLKPTPTQQSWLEEQSSITQRLRQTYPNLEVKILQERYITPSPDEQQKLESTQEVWLREVLIVNQEKPLIYARTLIPNFNKNNTWAQLEKLGTQPLGEILFNQLNKPQNLNLKRSAFSFSLSNTWKIPNQHNKQNQQKTPHLAKKFARLCSFYQNNQQLLLTEVFLDLE